MLYQKHQLDITASFLRNGGLDSLLAIGVGADPDSVSLTLVAGSWASCCSLQPQTTVFYLDAAFPHAERVR